MFGFRTWLRTVRGFLYQWKSSLYIIRIENVNINIISYLYIDIYMCLSLSLNLSLCLS